MQSHFINFYLFVTPEFKCCKSYNYLWGRQSGINLSLSHFFHLTLQTTTLNVSTALSLTYLKNTTHLSNLKQRCHSQNAMFPKPIVASGLLRTPEHVDLFLLPINVMWKRPHVLSLDKSRFNSESNENITFAFAFLGVGLHTTQNPQISPCASGTSLKTIHAAAFVGSGWAWGGTDGLY